MCHSHSSQSRLSNHSHPTHRRAKLAFGLLLASLSLTSVANLAQADSQTSSQAPTSAEASRHFQHCDQYASIQTAVLAAGNYYNPLSISEDRQYIGAVLQHKTDNHYIYTAAAGHPGADNVNASIQIPASYQLAAFWQTRGVEHWGQEYFSAEQTQLARQWQLPFYMTNASGYLKVYQPEDRLMSSLQARHKGLGNVAGVAEGHRIRVQEQPLQVATRLDQWQAQLAATAAGPDSLDHTGYATAAGPACLEESSAHASR